MRVLMPTWEYPPNIIEAFEHVYALQMPCIQTWEVHVVTMGESGIQEENTNLMYTGCAFNCAKGFDNQRIADKL